jgi:hypothetical protein
VREPDPLGVERTHPQLASGVSSSFRAETKRWSSPGSVDGGTKVDDAKRLNELERKNQRLKAIVADRAP